jgi:hypothetical protein
MYIFQIYSVFINKVFQGCDDFFADFVEFSLLVI